MNAGNDYKAAYRQAQANADLDGHPRYIHMYSGTLWISKAPPDTSGPMFAGQVTTVNPSYMNRPSATETPAERIARRLKGA